MNEDPTICSCHSPMGSGEVLAQFIKVYGVAARLGKDHEGRDVIVIATDPGARPIPHWYGGLDVDVEVKFRRFRGSL